MNNQESLELLVSVLLIAGALNWGAVAYFQRDLVKELSYENQQFEQYIKIAVGVAGMYAAFQLYKKLS